ncbi:PREDICTED: LOC109946288 [Prunus dulcis]|uniref:PREDICTED: LOC109946288 n=1 Tax=Prunus dulcis TaxID=3755 RepID=A0A5E4GIA2_PRUDU|nr:PREDICTED: LOC109946288 [Prunus dulcis]
MPQKGDLCAAGWGYNCWVFEAGRWRGGIRWKKHRRKKKKSVSFGGGGGKQQLLLLVGGREAASIASVGPSFTAKLYEVQVLRDQLVTERNLVDKYQRGIKRLKRDRAKTAEENQRQFQILQEENEKLSKIVYFYSKDMQKQLEALENLGKRKLDHERSSREN